MHGAEIVRERAGVSLCVYLLCSTRRQVGRDVRAWDVHFFILGRPFSLFATKGERARPWTEVKKCGQGLGSLLLVTS